MNTRFTHAGTESSLAVISRVTIAIPDGSVLSTSGTLGSTGVIEGSAIISYSISTFFYGGRLEPSKDETKFNFVCLNEKTKS